MNAYDGATIEKQIELLKRLEICHRIFIFPTTETN